VCPRDKLTLITVNEKRHALTMETMKNSHKGQTVIETALMIMLLFILFFGIAEIARFWWLKNQINNAARVGVRVAIVDTTLNGTHGTLTSPANIATCLYNSGTQTCGVGSSTGEITTTAIQIAACAAITNGSLCTGATVSLSVTGVDDSGNPGGTNFIPGGIVTVRVTSPSIGTIVLGLAKLSLGLIPVNADGTITLKSDSTMRHE
jgi:Flp pilus assembly protein TadG